MKFMIPLISIMMMKKSWDKTTIFLSILMVMSLITIFSPGTMLNMSYKNICLSQMSSSLIILSLWISMMMMMSSRNQIYKLNNNQNKFNMMIMWLTLTMLLVFSLQNMILFYIFFEMALIPTMILIIMWGYQPERLQASMYMIVYTVTASLPLLLIITMIMKMNYHLSFTMLMSSNMNYITNNKMLILIPLMLAFLVKSPMFFVHLWLPKAHVEAPMAGSMILAAILLKLGGYGLIMMSFLNTYSKMNKLIMMISLMGGIMACMMCMTQSDMKSLIAYSSINHMSLMISSILSNFSLGWKMALLIMIAHGLCSSGLFMMVGMMFEKTSSRTLMLNKSIILLSPTLSMMWFIMIMINMGAPPSINLLSEIFMISSMLIFLKSTILLLMFMIMASSTYNLYLYTTMNHGMMTLYNTSNKIYLSNYKLTMLLHITPIFSLITISYLMML